MSTGATAAAQGKMVNAFTAADLARLDPQTRATVERRARLLGPAYRLFYQKPVEVCRGRGVYLYDSAGNEYLDAYNNVASVGHTHPAVVRAVSEQMATLCTHTRYLQEGILRYGEQLRQTFDGPVRDYHTMFTCTGSEANDLAMRMAMHHTGRSGIIITSEAYHGNSFLTAGFSPSLGERSPLGTWVRRIPTPDSYRMPIRELGQRMARHVEEQIEDLERRGEGLAAFIADSLFSSDGIYSDPTDLLAPVAEVVRKAGGLFVADEVQSGFGRSGDRFWGYQRHGIQPDIITMGKPMGNGFPVAATIVAPDIVKGFGRDMRYFNTFGGNSVAIAAAQATLDVMQTEGLQENARRIGQAIRDGVGQLASQFEVIGDVRGAGLYVGVELVSDRAAKTPDGAAATYVVNSLREQRVLISATGNDSNVLKIRPPLVFDDSNVDRLVTALEVAFKGWRNHA
ncbi:aspartate aminotransferase family protein [Bordetella genomosp. 10]|uniref:Aspartate aminotransferase family protein n=2 Tax=Bordetella genomosp. 10 TaxID=1416804 RepID=A0A261S1W1_9BORD|nr:aspartate aminotransferase family protein [Bordetella genomosp. 10]